MTWGSKLRDLTPVERHGGMYFKRDDKFAPLGYGNINGSKLRQCIYLVDKWYDEGNLKGVASGSVSQSPQHAFIAAACRHYNVGCYIVSGVRKPLEHKYLRMAHEFGAHIVSSRVGYAQACGAQARKASLAWEGFRYLETNITLDLEKNSFRDIEGFHRVGAWQVMNIPEDVETLIIPCGSCNSVTSILYGIMMYPPPGLKRIVLMGIGNMGSNDIGYVRRRLRAVVEVNLGLDTDEYFDFNFASENAKYDMVYLNLNGTGYCTYQQEMREAIGDIRFHPRYEGKCIRYLKERAPEYLTPTTCFWIVGSDVM